MGVARHHRRWRAVGHPSPLPAPDPGGRRRPGCPLGVGFGVARPAAGSLGAAVDGVSDRRLGGRAVRVLHQGAPHRHRRGGRSADDHRIAEHRPRSARHAALLRGHGAPAAVTARRRVRRCALSAARDRRRGVGRCGTHRPCGPHRTAHRGRQPDEQKRRGIVQRAADPVQRQVGPASRGRRHQPATGPHPGRAAGRRGHRQRRGDDRRLRSAAALAGRSRRAAHAVTGGDLPGDGP